MNRRSNLLLATAFLFAATAASVRAADQGDKLPIPKHGSSAAAKQPALEDGFLDPPPDARPRVYWWWLNSNISRAGITRDLEEMKRKGIGGAMIFDAGMPAGPTPEGPRFMGPRWREMVRHAVAEAHRLGLELSVNLCSGWDSGGPWVTPQHACQKVVWSEITVKGPREFSQVLPLPAGVPADSAGRPVYYRDVAVQAFPARISRTISMAAASPKLTASSGQEQKPGQPSNAIDGDPSTFWVSRGMEPGEGPSPEHPEWLRLEFSTPYSAAALYLLPRRSFGPRRCELQCSQDGKSFRPLGRFEVVDGQPTTVPFPQTAARFFRLLITASYDAGSPQAPRNVQIKELALLKQGEKYVERFPIKYWRVKAGYQTLSLFIPAGGLNEQDPPQPGEVDVASAALVDLSGKLDDSGRLHWNVPPGKWSILRIGHTLTDSRVICASPGGEGYMLDFLSRQAMDLQFDAMAAKLLADVGPLAGKSLKYFHDDSWEVGSPNWTVDFPAEFRRRRGYDPRPYLPVLAGKIVDSRDISNRFLWDFRRTIGDCIAENHYARFRDLSHAHGIGIHPESGGPFFPHIDALKCLGRNDIPMGEFWGRLSEPEGRVPWRAAYRLSDSVKQAASAAHIYGKKHVQAEACTTVGPHWEKSPYDLKDLVDLAFCQGLTRAMCHTFTHSPPDYGKPGIEYFAGTHFNPNVTWWEQARAWTDYLARCQFLLAQGRFVADVCYYYGEGVPSFVPGKRMITPPLPFGYDHDVTNAEVLTTRMSSKNGRITLPDGMSYRLLVLPEHQPMSCCVLQKISTLVRLGATVVGPRPTHSPGLQDYPQADQVVRTLADQLWGPCDGKSVKQHPFGLGKVICGKTLAEVLSAEGLAPDFEFKSARADTRLDWIHRRCPAAEIYFVSNQGNRFEEVECTFRVSGRAPELWSPDTGTIRAQAVYRVAGGRTRVPLRLASKGSVFVVFRAEAEKDPIVSVAPGADRDDERLPPSPRQAKEHPGVEVLPALGGAVALQAWEPGTYRLQRASGKTATVRVRRVPPPRAIAGPWEIRFPAGWGAPESAVFEKLESWTKQHDPGIKYFSGTATYRKTFNLPRSLLQEDICLDLDLGRVKNLAEVTLNGRRLGILWKPPFRLAITSAVRPGDNLLEVAVTNLWPNRLIGDQFLPPDQRFTHTNVSKFQKDSPLLDSGLLGPVRIVAARRLAVKFAGSPPPSP